MEWVQSETVLGTGADNFALLKTLNQSLTLFIEHSLFMFSTINLFMLSALSNKKTFYR